MEVDKLPCINTTCTEDNALDQSTALNKIVIQLLEGKRKETFRSWIAFIVACVIFIVSFLFVSYDNQRVRDKLIADNAIMRLEFTQAITDERTAWLEYVSTLETIDTVTTTETTTDITQSVEGEGSNLINGNQYYDTSTHNQTTSSDVTKKE